MAGCGDVLSLEDLQTAKKHQIFEAEVITGKAGGVAGGATIDTATNPVTGQTQQTLPSILADLGFDVQPWTSSTGGVLASANQVFLNDTPSSLGLGDYYAWGSTFPKTVPAGTDPALVGSGYIMRSSRLAGVQAREALRRSYAEVGYTMVAGSFELGGVLNSPTDVLLHEGSGKAYSGSGPYPQTVLANTVPGPGFTDESAITLGIYAAKQFISVAAMKADKTLKVGSIAEVLFKLPRATYYARYLVRNDITADGYGDHLLNNGLKAELTHNGELMAEWFGLVPDDITKAAANVTVMQKCILYAYNKKPMTNVNNATPDGYMALQFNTPIKFGAGEFFFDGNSPFRVNTDLLLNNIYRRGLKLSGAGRESTVFTMLETAAGNKDRWFYDTEEYANRGGIDFLQWRDFTLRSYKVDGTERDTVPSGRKVGAIRGYSTGFEKYFDMENIVFHSLDTATFLDGTANADLNHFRNCRFSIIRDAIGRFNNNQVVETRYSNCDFESIMGDIFQFGGSQGGGYIVVDGGSMIMDPKFAGGVVDTVWTKRKAVFHYDMDATGVTGLRSEKHMLKNVSFELYDDLAKLIVYERDGGSGGNGGAFDITAEDCSWHTVYRKTGAGTIVSIPDTDPPVDLVSVSGNVSGKVTFKGCHLNERHKYTMAGADDNYAAHSILFDGCHLLWEAGYQGKEKSLSSLMFLYGKASARAENTTCIQGPASSGLRYTSTALDFDMPGFTSALAYQPKIRQAMVKCHGAAWPQGITTRVLLPVRSFINDIRIKVPPVATGTSTSCFVSINNGLSWGDPGYVEYYRSPLFNEAVGFSKLVTLDSLLQVDATCLVGAAYLNHTAKADISSFVSLTYTGL